MYLKINDIEINAREGMTWLEAMALLPGDSKPARPLGICVQGKTYSLTDKAIEYARARVLTYADEEGRRIYERSLMLLFTTAVQRVEPGAHVRIEHSYGRGIYIRRSAGTMSEAFVNAVEREMHALAEADIPVARRTVTTDNAQEYFGATGQTDRLRILGYREFPYFTLYQIGENGPEDYYYGQMLPSTGYMRVFSCVPYGDGVVVMQPSKEDPDKLSEFKDMPKLFATYAEMAEWNHILQCENAADLNDMIEAGKLREFIRVNEALQENKIMKIAEQFKASGAQLLMIAGPSSSGKTTFANRLCIALRVLGMRPVKMSLDDYYRDRDQLPVLEDGSVDLECVEALDTDLISAHLRQLMDGEPIEMPVFNFVTGKRDQITNRFEIEKGQPLVVEGIHGLNDRLTEGIDRSEKFKVYISALTMLNLDDHNRIRTTDARLLRRIVRDHQFRGTPPEETMAMWGSVRNGEDSYIFPYQEEADAMFNSTLTYELCFMKKYAYPALAAIKPESPHYTLARRLVKFLNYIEVTDVENEIPINSLLREFIGGCTFYRDEE